ncbi:MAG: hypothetical protein LBD90_06095 [Bifidobacteriaceae bacterium]|nr:hypothetical protein [Bifidobacteriaceae bacterium]
MPKPVLPRWWLSAVAWIALAIQLAVLYLPRLPDVGASLLPGADKAVHAAVFAFAVWAWALRSRRRWLVAAIFAANAIWSEVAQAAFLPQRSGSPWDALADLAGIALGLYLAARWRPGGSGWPAVTSRLR